MQTIRKVKFFWAWQDEKEEAWLREMAQQGWHLVSPSYPCVYTFIQGEARDVAYRLDYITSRVDRGEYMQLFQDAGWEHVGELVGWQYFRKDAKPGEDPQIYTDPESKIDKYRRLFGFLIILTPIWVYNLAILGDIPYKGWALVRASIMISISVLWGCALLRIGLRIRQLKRL